MTITPTLIRWSRTSNRRRAVELAVLGLPWMVAGVAATLAASQGAGLTGTVAVGGGASIGLAVAGFRRHRRSWRTPLTTAHDVDRAHHTSDLMASAAAIEAGTRPDAPLAPLVLGRARALVPTLEATAVPPLRLRVDPGGALSALAAVALVFLLGATGHRVGARGDDPAGAAEAAARMDDHELAKILETAQAIARDQHAPSAARAEAARAAEAIARARKAPSAAGALGELSEAARALDRAARALADQKPPSAAELAKLAAPKLAEQLAEAARQADSATLAALAREALRRAAADPAAAKQLADQLARAAAAQKAAGGGDAAAQARLTKLADAAAKMAAGNNDGARSDLAALDRLSRSNPAAADSLPAQLDAARSSLGAMRGDQRDALNRAADARARAQAQAAQAARAAMRPGAPRPDGATSDQDAMAQAARARAGAGAGSGSGAMPGHGRTPGDGRMAGTGPLTPGGAAPGAPSGNPGGAPSPDNAPPGPATMGPDSVVSVRTGSGHAGHGPTGPGKPSGAGAPSSFTAEQVETAPAVTPEGAVRAIAERASGIHQPTEFDRARDQYEAIAEAAIRKDDIPLTRRDYIQRYFAALRTREEP